MYAVSAFANASLNVLKILSHMSAEGLLRLSSTVSLTCFLMFRWEGTRSTAHAKGGNKMTTNLDNDDHLPRLLDPKQVGNRHDVLLKLDKALVVAPVGVGEQDLLRALDKVTLRLRSRLLHHQGKVVALDLETVLDGLAEVFQDGLVEVLEVREEVGREGRVELGDELEALPRVDARVIPRSGRVKRRCSGKKKSVMHPHVGETRRTESFGAGRLHRRPEVLDDLSGAGRLVEHLDALEEGRKGDSGDLVTTELSKELLLSREVQVLVRDDRVLRRGSTVSAVLLESNARTYPDRAHVLRDSVRRNSLVVLGEEDEAGVLRVDEALAKLLDLGLEKLRLQKLVWEGDEGEVEEGGDDASLEAFWLRETIPEAVEVGFERCLKVRKGSGANVVANDEEEESLVLRTLFEYKK